MHRIHILPLVIVGLLAGESRSTALIRVAKLTPEKARELGITMKSRPNGSDGTLVWIEFKKQGVLEAFTHAKLQMNGAQGKHLISARLEPEVISRGPAGDVVSISFAANPSQLKHCTFWVVAHGSSRGDVGYILRVDEFLDLGSIQGATANPSGANSCPAGEPRSADGREIRQAAPGQTSPSSIVGRRSRLRLSAARAMA